MDVFLFSLRYTYRMSGTDNDEVMIVGAGPAGLAVGACLKRANIPSIILERNQQVGSAWHRHYDRLHLHTDKFHSSLPFVPFPKTDPRYPSRTQVINYLESYARMFQLDIRFGQCVTAAYQQDGRWFVQTQDSSYNASNLVIAAGNTREPVVPTWRGQDLFQGEVLHSSEYKNGEPFRGQRVLVVGFGNSGGEIAIDLWERGAQPSIAVKSGVNVIQREMLGLPFQFLAIPLSKLPARLADLISAPVRRLAIGDISKYGLEQLPYGPITQARKHGSIPLIDVGTLQLIKEGHLKVYPGITEFKEDGVRFTDGREATFEAVILATGYRPRVSLFLDTDSNVMDEEGTPLSSGGTSSLPGLYFCGYHTSSTGMLREVGIEARRITASIAAKKR